MASMKKKLEEDDHNNDQEDEHNNDQLNPVVITSNEVRSRSREDEDTSVEQQQLVVACTSNQALSYQLAPRFDPVFNRAPLLYQWQPHFGSLNQPASSPNPTFNPGPLFQQPRRGSFNQAQLHQLQSPRGSLNEPGPSSTPAFNRVPLHELQPPRGSLNQPGSSSKPVVNRPPLLQLLPPRSNEVQQNPLPPSRSTQEPDLQLTLMTSQQSSHSSIWARYMQGLVNGLSANIQSLNAELYAMEQTVGSTNVLPTGVFQGGDDYRSQLQWINAELNSMQTRMRESVENMTNYLPTVDPIPCIVSSHQGGGSTSSNVLFSRAEDDKNKGHSDDAKLPFVLLDQGTGSGPGSTSGNITAGGESEGLVNIAAGDMLSATDADEKQGEEENADTSQDGNTPGNSSAQ